MSRVNAQMAVLVALGVLCAIALAVTSKRTHLVDDYSRGYAKGYADCADACNNAMDGLLSDSLCACLARSKPR